jgi:uncharacterized coiled-coil protein SlyX
MLMEARMATLEERVGQLEGRMQEQSCGFNELKAAIVGLEAKMSDDLVRLETKMSDDLVGLETKMSDDLVRLETKMSNDLVRLDARMSDGLHRLDDKIGRQFVWIVGMLVTVLAAVVGGLASR